MRILEVLVAWVAALSCYATAVIVPAVYVWDVPQVVIFGYAFVFLAWAPVAYWVYVGSNTASALLGQSHPGLRWQDYLSSMVAAFSILMTALWVGVRMYQSNAQTMKIMDIPEATWILIALLVFSLINLVLLRTRHREAWAHVTAARAVPLPPPPPAPAAPAPAAPATYSGTGIVVVLLLCALVVVAILMATNRVGVGPTGKKQATVDPITQTAPDGSGPATDIITGWEGFRSPHRWQDARKK